MKSLQMRLFTVSFRSTSSGSTEVRHVTGWPLVISSPKKEVKYDNRGGCTRRGRRRTRQGYSGSYQSGPSSTVGELSSKKSRTTTETKLWYLDFFFISTVRPRARGGDRSDSNRLRALSVFLLESGREVSSEELRFRPLQDSLIT